MPNHSIHRKKLKSYSRELRRNETSEERKLWFMFLKNLPIKFKRQVIVLNYIVDFYCASKKIIIELDGNQHYLDEGEQNDKIRDEKLTELGFTVLRYTNADINLKFDNVCADIYRYIED